MTDFILPDIGEGIVECELVEWLVKEGDHIVEDQPVADVMTDKALVQIPAMHSGVVRTLYYQKGDIAKVHEPLFAIDIEGEAASTETSANTSAAAPSNVPASNVPVVSAPTDSAPAASSGEVIEDFILPDIGEGIVECELVDWLIAEGEVIAEDQPVADVMTDKALVQIPAKHGGRVVKLYYAKGDIAKVHTPLFSQAIAGSETAAAPAAPLTAAATPAVAQTTAEPVRQGKALASPAVRRLARENHIDIALVPGSGKKGRVMKQDIEAYIANGGQAPAVQAAAPAAQAPAAQQQTTPVSGGVTVEPLRGVKAAMAKQMTDSVFTIPHFTVSDELPMDALIAARKTLKPEFEAQGVKLSFMPFFIKALSLALKAFPIINARVNDQVTEIHYHQDHNIGLAVDSKIGLLVPNIKQVQNLSLLEVAQELNRIVDLAREGRLTNNELQGGTISISNIGVLGGTTATPVINKPESAIVALGKTQRLPRFDENDNVVPVNIMQVSWSGDHRIIDGATMVRFNNLWMSYLQQPMLMLAALR